MNKLKLFIYSLLLFFSSFSLIAKNEVKEGVFEDAVVYTGVTQYFFKDSQTGKTFQVNVPSDEAHKSSVPKNLLEDPNEIEGLPGANPKMIGKKFKITKRKDGSVQITLVDQKKK